MTMTIPSRMYCYNAIGKNGWAVPPASADSTYWAEWAKKRMANWGPFSNGSEIIVA